MKNDSPEKKHRLLDDVLREDSFDTFNQDLQRQAIGTFRRARLMRRVATASALATSLACLIAAAMLSGQFGSKSKSGSEIVSASSSPAAAPIEINERQLVELFPPDSCFVAEVNGKKVLVFRDAELRQQFLN